MSGSALVKGKIFSSEKKKSCLFTKSRICLINFSFSMLSSNWSLWRHAEKEAFNKSLAPQINTPQVLNIKDQACS